MKLTDNIILIGMPGSGKSTVGVLLAKALMYSFLDTDLSIQSDLGKRLYQIIDEIGKDGFLKEESRVIKGLPACHRTVIATGGSAVYGEDAMKHLKENGVAVYLQLSCDEIKGRINNLPTRGIAMKNGETLDDLYRERVPLYEKYADIAVDCNGLTMEQSMEKVVHCLSQIRKSCSHL